jgi:hypothetical protein
MAFGQWTEFESTSVAKAAYDAMERRLCVVFRSGRSYEYYDVPPSVFEWLLRVPNKGAYVGRVVVGQFSEKQLSQREGVGSSAQGQRPGDLEGALRASIERLASKDG